MTNFPGYFYVIYKFCVALIREHNLFRLLSIFLSEILKNIKNELFGFQ